MSKKSNITTTLKWDILLEGEIKTRLRHDDSPKGGENGELGTAGGEWVGRKARKRCDCLQIFSKTNPWHTPCSGHHATHQ